jgi:hypothetical protein
MMFPYARVPGTDAMPRPTAQQPDAPLGDDDRTGLRVLYPDLSDSLHIGSIQGRILRANLISLPASPSGVTQEFLARKWPPWTLLPATSWPLQSVAGVVLRRARRNSTEPIGLKNFP